MSSLKFALKLAVTVGLLALIARNIDSAALLEVVADARPALILMALVFCFGLVASEAIFWTAAMRALASRMALGPALVFSIVGWFFSNVAPSTVGADLFRVAQMKQMGVRAGAAIRTVLAARLMSFATLLSVIAIGLPLTLSYAQGAFERALILSALLSGGAALGALIVAGPALARAPSSLGFPGAEKLVRLSSDLRTILGARRAAPATWVFSVLQHLLRIAIIAMIAAGLNTRIEFAALFALVPISLLFAMVPISLGAWGVREASFVYFLGLAGATAETALAISLTFGMLRLVVGAVGGGVWVIARAEHYRFDVSPAIGASPEAKDYSIGR